MPAVPSSIIEPIWDQFSALLPAREVFHPLGCHRRRITDRIVFDKLVALLVYGGGYAKIADARCSATTIRRRRDEWIAAGVFAELEKLCLEIYHHLVGLDLADLCVDGCITKAPCGGQATGRSPVDRGKQGIKRSVLTDGQGIPLGCVIAGANRHDSPLLAPTLQRLTRLDLDLPATATVHLDAGYDSNTTRDFLNDNDLAWQISPKGTPLQTGKRWPVERTNSWHNQGFRKLATCTERRTRVIDALIALANTIIIVRRLIRTLWTTHRWNTRPPRRP